jgi:hypothetical protein
MQRLSPAVSGKGLPGAVQAEPVCAWRPQALLPSWHGGHGSGELCVDRLDRTGDRLIHGLAAIGFFKVRHGNVFLPVEGNPA